MKALITTLALLASSYALAQTSLVLHCQSDAAPLRITLLHTPSAWSMEQTITGETTLYYYATPPGGYLLIANNEDGNRVDTTMLVLAPDTKNQFRLHWREAAANSIALTKLPGEFQYYPQELLNTQPTEANDAVRSLWGLGPAVPATSHLPTGPRLTVNGQDPLYIRYTVDGFDNTDQYWGGQRNRMNLTGLSGAGITAGQAPVGYGQAGSGLVRMQTLSGTHSQHLSVYGMAMPPGTAADNGALRQPDLAGLPRATPLPRYQGGITWSGQIIPNKTFFMVDGAYTQEVTTRAVRSPDLGVDTTLESLNKYLWLSGRIDQHWNARFTTSVTVMGNVDSLEKAGTQAPDTLRFPEAGVQQVQNAVAIGIRNTYQGSDFSAVLNYQYSIKRGYESLAALSDAPTVTVFNPEGNVFARLGGSPNQEHSYRSHQWQAQYMRHWQGHQLTTGIEVTTTRHVGLSGGNPLGEYEVQISSSQLADLQGLGLGLSYEDIPTTSLVRRYHVGLNYGYVEGGQTVYRLFVQDEFTLGDRLYVQAGLGWEYDHLSRAAAQVGDLNNLAPQVQATYPLTHNTALRGGAGLYYSRLPYVLYDLARSQSSRGTHFRRQLELLQRLGLLSTEVDVNAMTYDGASYLETGSSYLSGPPAESFGPNSYHGFTNERYILNPNGWDNPMVVQTSLALEHRPAENTLFSVTASYHEGFQQLRLIDVNAPGTYSYLPDSIVARDPMVADATRNIPVLYDAFGPYILDIDGALLRDPSRRIMMHDTEGRYRYLGLTLMASHTPAGHWLGYRASYTLSRHLTTVPLSWQATTATAETVWAPSLQDRTHILTGLVNISPWEFLGFTLHGIAQSGQPYTRVVTEEEFGTTDLDGDGSPLPDIYPGTTPNQYRLPWSYLLNGSLRLKAKLGDNYIMVEGTVFNLLNRSNFSGYYGFGLLENQVQPGGDATHDLVQNQASAPLRGQVMLKVGF